MKKGRVSPCQQCRQKADAAATVERIQMKGPFGLITFKCSEGHQWLECREHDYRIRPIAEGESISSLQRRYPKSWCFCAPEIPDDDGESDWVEVKVKVEGNYGERSWEETVPRSLLALYDAVNPTFCFDSLDGKHADVWKKYSELDIDVASTADEDLDKWLESFCKDHLGSELDQDEFYDKDYIRFRQFHAKWTPETLDEKALARACGFDVKK